VEGKKITIPDRFVGGVFFLVRLRKVAWRQRGWSCDARVRENGDLGGLATWVGVGASDLWSERPRFLV